VRRREFITLLGGAAAAWPLAARAQQTMPVIGLLSSAAHGLSSLQIVAFRRGLHETGYVEGQNVAIEYRLAEGQYARLPALAAELVQRRVTVMVATGSGSAPVAKAATATIPVVFVTGVDPIASGLVAGLSRPGGNVTGVSFFTTALEGKRLGLLHELASQATVVAALINPSNPAAEAQTTELEEASRKLGLKLHVVRADNERDFDTAFASLVQHRAGALVVCADAFFFSRRERIVALAAHHAVPAIYEWREFAEAGGLASYGTSLTDAYRQAGAYTGRILKGEKPADLPVMQSTRFEFVINLKSAKALGLEVPPGLSARADEVIE
jgi:putative ABC transport system substrate-binding protein